MYSGLQFNPVQEGRYQRWFVQRYLVQNRRTGAVVIVVFLGWLYWFLSQELTGRPGWMTTEPALWESWQQWTGLLLVFSSLMMTSLWLPWCARFQELFCGLLCVGILAVLLLLALGLEPGAFSPLLLLPMLLSGTVFRLRFIVVLPCQLLLWLGGLIMVNFTQHQTVLAFSQWIVLMTTLMTCLLILNYQAEIMQRRLFLLELGHLDHRVPDHGNP